MNKQKLIHPKFPHLSWEGYNKNLSSVHRIPPFGHKSSLLIRRKGLQGFTLVELIVVITILAILGTIAFVSLQGYSSNARDSVRTSDLSRMKSTLELYNLDAGNYPQPSEVTVITYSGAVAWAQGIFGETVKINVSKLDKIPRDPLTEKKYVYSTTSTRNEYSLAGAFEGETLSYLKPSQQNQPHTSPLLRGEGIAQASTKTANLKLTGTYNGKVLKVSTGSTTYILAMPSIISSSGTTVEEIVINKTLAYDGYKNLPFQYSGAYNVEGENNLNLVNSGSIVVFEGDLLTLSDTTSVGILARKTLIEKLQQAYTGTSIITVGEIAQILNTNTTDEISTEYVSTNLVANNLGGSIKPVTTVSNTSCSGTMPDNAELNGTQGTATWSYNTTPGVCRYDCQDGFHTENGGVSCVSDTRSCVIANATATETWNGSAWGACIVTSCNSGYTQSGNVCNENDLTITGNDTIGRNWSDGTFATNCNGYRNPGLGKSYAGSTGDGIYWIKPDVNAAFKVYCDMTVDGGGWTLAIRLNTNDAVTRKWDNAAWSTLTEVGTLTGSDDYFSQVFYTLNFTNLNLQYSYGANLKISATYNNSSNTSNLKTNVTQTSNNTKTLWLNTYMSGGTDFFGNNLSFQTIGNGNDYSRIWYNLVPIGACNQGGSIGHIGDYGTHNWNWEVARGSNLEPTACQHNIYRLGLGLNYDKKSYGGTNIIPLDYYNNGIMYIYVK